MLFHTYISFLNFNFILKKRRKSLKRKRKEGRRRKKEKEKKWEIEKRYKMHINYYITFARIFIIELHLHPRSDSALTLTALFFLFWLIIVYIYALLRVKSQIFRERISLLIKELNYNLYVKKVLLFLFEF